MFQAFLSAQMSKKLKLLFSNCFHQCFFTRCSDQYIFIANFMRPGYLQNSSPNPLISFQEGTIETLKARYFLQPLRNRTSYSGIALPHTISRQTHKEWNSTSVETQEDIHTASTSAKGNNGLFHTFERLGLIPI